MGSSNFLQHNPTQTNQESDSSYTAESLRSGGIPVDAILPSPWLNKIWYQCTTAVAALMQMMASKGYVLSDANLNVLSGVLANILTSADFPLGLPKITAKVDLVGYSGSVIAYLITPAAAGFYRVSAEAFIYSPTVTSTLAVEINWTQNGQGLSGTLIPSTTVVTSIAAAQGECVLYGDAGIPIQYVVSWSGPGLDHYDVHIRLEAL